MHLTHVNRVCDYLGMMESDPDPCPNCGYIPGDPIPIGRRLKARRDELKLTRAEVIGRLLLLDQRLEDKDPQWLYGLELVRKTPLDRTTVRLLCKVLGLRTDGVRVLGKGP